MLLDLTGQKFGDLTVLHKSSKRLHGHVYWVCQCKCGKIYEFTSYRIRHRKISSCIWCIRHKHNLIGKKFGNLIVLEETQGINLGRGNNRQWICQCKCGELITLTTSMLIQESNKSCGCLNQYKEKETSAINALFSRYKRRAKDRKLPFSLLKSELIRLSKQNCAYCGEKPLQKILCGSRFYIYNGIDRVDNSKGYAIDNVVTCCKKCNIAKHTMSYDEFINHIKKIYANLH